MYPCQIEPGSMRPNTGRPCAFLIGSLVSVPTHTAVDTVGVKPTIQASLFWLFRLGCCTVPVLPACARPPATAIAPDVGTAFIDSVTLRATCCGTACSPVAVPWS